jgi:FtsZ-binding cell division protein ZapB
MQVADEDTKKRLAQAASGMSLLKMEVELLEMKKKKQRLESDHAVASVDLTSADVDSDNADSDLSTNSGVETTD